MQDRVSTIVPDPIVRNVTTTYSHVPSTILATSRQLQDLARFCNISPTHDSTFIGFDKTFNLSELHVTASVYKNLAVKRITTINDHPIDHLFFVLQGDSSNGPKNGNF